LFVSTRSIIFLPKTVLPAEEAGHDKASQERSKTNFKEIVANSCCELGHASFFGWESFRGGDGEVEECGHAEASTLKFSFEEGQKVGRFLVTLQTGNLLGLLSDGVFAVTFRNLLDALSEIFDCLVSVVEPEGDFFLVATVVFDGLLVGEVGPLLLLFYAGTGASFRTHKLV